MSNCSAKLLDPQVRLSDRSLAQKSSTFRRTHSLPVDCVCPAWGLPEAPTRSQKTTQTRTVHCSARSKAVLCGLPAPCPAFGLPEPWLWPACAVACLCPACLWAARALPAVCRAVAECTELFLRCAVSARELRRPTSTRTAACCVVTCCSGPDLAACLHHAQAPTVPLTQAHPHVLPHLFSTSALEPVPAPRPHTSPPRWGGARPLFDHALLQKWSDCWEVWMICQYLEFAKLWRCSSTAGL